MPPVAHRDVCLLALHGGGQVGEDGASPRFPLHAQWTPRRLLSAEQEAARAEPAASQRLQAGVNQRLMMDGLVGKNNEVIVKGFGLTAY